MKQIVFLIIFAGFVSCMDSYAQKIVYTYDASGNCTGRSYSSTKSATTGEGTDHLSEKQNDVDLIFQTDDNSIKIYPNPNNGQFQVELTGFDDVLNKGTITIFSARGLVVFKASALQPINPVHLNHQPNGTYVLQISVGDQIFIHKVVVDK